MASDLLTSISAVMTDGGGADFKMGAELTAEQQALRDAKQAALEEAMAECLEAMPPAEAEALAPIFREVAVRFRCTMHLTNNLAAQCEAVMAGVERALDVPERLELLKQKKALEAEVDDMTKHRMSKTQSVEIQLVYLAMKVFG